ncbi:hypothetical protein NDR87_03650 [Nocardia sp. CDC159]|uniref:Uncharacterized protein n=1 Tax=Nocardia pulmonis TaxID=2951408 RepID=A0A9X2E118_9NOCA|nr:MULTISPECIES: hypothetical protein [Nocardia]MCM6771889.1 hypothetical protein [Nocardia pulmonis]MCM6785453.1 hypothetical protein [Nocardia sp. CDC159]
MSLPRTTSKSLSDSEIRQLAARIEAGQKPTVWFTAAAVGIEAGRSGKVVGMADPSEPDYLRVRPAGSTDTLAFSPSELTLASPHRRGRR